MKIKLFTLPNLVTLCNLACGCAAVQYAFHWNPNAAFWFIAAAAVFDFLDGAVARLTGQYSEVGKQLDSLADVVSFGVAPSAVLFALFQADNYLWDNWIYEWSVPYTVFAVALFSALRLAKFNVDETQSEEFTGLPTPAAALAIAALARTVAWDTEFQHIAPTGMPNELLIVLAAVASYLLVSPLRMFSLKFKSFGWRGNELRYMFLAASAVLVATLGVGGVAAAVGLYIAMSAVRQAAPMRHTGKN